jgi:rhodanese-related sulfurtransferase
MSIFDTLSSLLGKNKATSSGPPANVDKSVLLQKIRQSELFRDMPETSLEEMFQRMETVNMRSDDVIIREGEEGDYYYLLAAGTADVTRRMGNSSDPQVVAQLTEPTGFGEEALISNAKRNATVIMTSNGIVMRLSKEAFEDYIKEPLLTWLSPLEAQEKVAKGAKWIDVRGPEQSRQSRLHGAISIAMEELRSKAEGLDRNGEYVCYCENARLSSTAAFLLRQRGFSVSVLRGGLQGLKRAGIA